MPVNERLTIQPRNPGKTNVVKIVSDNKQAEKILKDIAEIITAHGAYLDEDMQIHCKDGGISVHSPNDKPRRLFQLPHDVLIPYENFDIGIKKNEFVLKGTKKETPEHLTKLIEHMLALYNATDQLQNLCNASPWIACKQHTGIINMLLQNREGDDIRDLETALQDPVDEEALTKHVFFRTRLMKLRLHKVFRKYVPVLLPLVDSLNHHLRGCTFTNDYPEDQEDTKASLIVPYVPVEGSDECFAKYRRMDSMDTYIDYAFIDQNTPMVRSIPLQIKLENIGTLQIRALDGYMKAEEIPERLQDLLFYMPTMTIDHKRNHIELSHIYIPQKAALRSLRRIIRYVLQNLKPDIDPETETKSMLTIEKEIVQANHTYYCKLQKLAAENKGPDIHEDLTRIIDLQLEKIENYKNLIGNIKQ